MPKHQKPTVQTVKKQLKKIRDLSVELAEAEYELGLLGLVGIDRISNKKASKKKASKKKASKKRASTKPLSLRDQKIVRLLLDQPELTQKEIASRFGIHQAQVSQIKKKAGIPMLSRSEVAEKMRKASKPKVKVSSKKPTKKTTRKTSGKKVFLSDTVFKEVKTLSPMVVKSTQDSSNQSTVKVHEHWFHRSADSCSHKALSKLRKTEE